MGKDIGEKVADYLFSPKRWLKRGLLAAGLAAYYTFAVPSGPTRTETSVQLPKRILAVKTDLPKYEVVLKSGLESMVNTAAADFSDDFTLKTDRYTVIKKEDNALVKNIGHIAAMGQRFFFWDYDMGLGLDEERTKNVILQLENNNDLRDITVRINHAAPFEDAWRVLFDKDLQKRNNWAARMILGVPTTVLGSAIAEFARVDMYNPITRTANLYSNIEVIADHELGHHEDFQRFTSDWEYAITNFFFPARLYKEYRANMNAMDMLPKQEKNQGLRYLLPAFLTYILAGYAYSRKKLQQMEITGNLSVADMTRLGREGIKELIENAPEPDVSMAQETRHFLTTNAMLYGGIESFMFAAAMGVSFAVSAAAFAGGFLATKVITNSIGKRIVPYNFD